VIIMKFIVIASIMLQVFALGVRTDPVNLLTCVRRRSWLIRIILAMFVGVPLLAVVLAKTLDASVLVKGAILLMATAAVAPMLPKKLLKLGVDAPFAESLSAVTMVLAIPLVPLTAAALGVIFGRDIVVSPAAVAGTLGTTFLLPFAIGMALKPALGDNSQRVGYWAGLLGSLVLGVLVVLLLVAQRGTIFPLLWRSLPVIALFVGGSLLIGHLIGGPDPGERTALAVATVTRHPGLAILIATTSFPNANLLPAILAVVLGSAIAAIPYTAWRKQALAARPGPPLPPLRASANVR
jgi:BASS family bile acid:Na+ symporter